MKNILCVAAHPDDEILGCGATLAKHVESGDHVQVVLAAEGITSRDVIRNATIKKEEFDQLYASAEKANKLVGVEKVHYLGLPDNRMDSLDLLDVIKKIETIVNDFKPEIIYTHFAGDLNIDHQILNKAVLTACRPQPNFCVKEIFSFEVPSATHWSFGDVQTFFKPNYYVDIEKTLAKKIEALNAYESEMRPFPHARSVSAVQALATWRGSLIGSKAAEAFEVLRIIRT